MGREERRQQRIARRKKRRIVTIVVVLLALAVLPYAYAALHLGYSEEDRQIARDLAALSGLSEDAVFDIRDTQESWAPVTENIFVYKKILGLPAPGVVERQRTRSTISETTHRAISWRSASS